MGKTLKKNPLYLLLFMIPTVAAFIIGFVYPFIMGIYLSLCKFKTPKHIDFIGFKNYLKLVEGGTNTDRFLQSFWFTALFAVLSTVLINVLAFTVAVLLTKNFGGTNLFRTIFFMPNLLGGVLLGSIWTILINGILSVFKESLTNKGIYGLIGLLIVLLWQQIGYMMIIYVAGLQGVSEDLKEAAKIDGADSKQILFKVTIPLVMPSISMCTFLTLTNGFKLFDQNIAMTGGLPNHETEMLALNIYNTFYGTRGQMGFAQAKAVVFFLIVGLIAIVQLKITQSKEAD
ncbi:MAG: sugar ABC transporter permease [Clostridia bacterium]|nr:sugar ABC transporter permease [Clostridia bacterium]